MNVIAGSASATPFDEDGLRRGAASVRHPLTRALLVLTFTTGLIDAVSYLALGRVFTANMTGNIVLLGFAFAGARGLSISRSSVALIVFLTGAVAGGRLASGVSGSTIGSVAAFWWKRCSLPLALCRP